MITVKFLNNIKYLEPIEAKYHVHDCYELIYYHEGNGFAMHGAPTINQSKHNYTFHTSKSSSKETLLKERIFFMSSNEYPHKPEELTYEANSYFIYPPFTPHAEKHKTKTSLTTIGFTLQDKNIPKTIKYYDNIGTVKTYVNKIRSEFLNKQHLYDGAIESLLKLLLIESNRFFKY